MVTITEPCGDFYEIPLKIKKEFKCKSFIKGYHGYIKDWTPGWGETLSARPEPEKEIDKYAAAVTKGLLAV